MDPEQNKEIWHVEANGQVFETDFAEMTAWIGEGALLRHDKVRKGDLRWIEAEKVPSLITFFNAKDEGTLPPIVTEAKPDSLNSVGDCCVHSGVPAAFSCTSCLNHFCRSCPSSYGGTVKLCPYCGAMCSELAKPEAAVHRPISHSSPITAPFGAGDLVEALTYPFRFKTSLVLGTLMFAFFSVGRAILGFGGIFMIGSALMCWMLANTLTFGILANTVENMAAGRTGLNFMPTFEDFSAWDDVFQPFFLMIGVYISSFGPVAAVVLIVFLAVAGPPSAVGKGSGTADTGVSRSVVPELPYAAGAAEQSQRVRELLKRTADEQRVRTESINNGIVPTEPAANASSDQLNGEQINRMIAETQKAQLESAIGEAPDTAAARRSAMLRRFTGSGVVLLLLGGLSLIWAFFYYPAACAVAGYTQSFGAVVNPLVGLDTARRLGTDYLKLLLICICIAVVFVVASAVSGTVLSAFDLPGVGNVPAAVVDSVVSFYLYIVFAVVLGSLLYKGASRLELPGA